MWDHRAQVLYWVDIEGERIHVFDPATSSDRAVDVGEMVGCVALRRSGGVVAALKRGFAGVDLDTGAVSLLATPEAHLPGHRFNDGRCDPRGRFWAGTMAIDGSPGAGSLLRLDPDGTVHRILEGTTISNGLAWSADGATLYYIDTGGQAIQAFDFDLETGGVSRGRAVVDVPAELGRPDGMAIDVEGMLWVALWDGGLVTRWDPTSGALLDRVTVPVSRPTSCAFGGPSLEDLYITSARSGLGAGTLEAQPLAGGLFRARVGVRGVPEFEFGLPVSARPASGSTRCSG